MTPYAHDTVIELCEAARDAWNIIGYSLEPVTLERDMFRVSFGTVGPDEAKDYADEDTHREKIQGWIDYGGAEWCRVEEKHQSKHGTHWGELVQIVRESGDDAIGECVTWLRARKRAAVARAIGWTRAGTA